MEKVAYILGKMGTLPVQRWGKAIARRRVQRKEPEGCAGDGRAPDVA